MIFVCDEGVDAVIVKGLRAVATQVVWVAEACPGAPDDKVLEAANSLGAVVVTSDKDFGELVYRLGRAHCGVLLLRLHGMAPERKAQVVLAAIDAMGAWPADGFAVLTERRLRLRSAR